MKKKLIYNNYLEFANLFFASMYLFSLGCTILNPAFTTGTLETSSESGILITTGITTNRTNGDINETSTAGSGNVADTDSTTYTTETSAAVDQTSSSGEQTSSTSTTSDFSMCGDCRVDPMEDCDICNFNFEIGICTEECDIFYPLDVLEKNLSLYCGDFNYCEGLDCGQCEADLVCYILHYKKIIKAGNEPGTFKLTATSWITEPINPDIMLTLTYEDIPNSYLIPNNGAVMAGLFNGDIWLTEVPYYKNGSSVTNISCSVTIF